MLNAKELSNLISSFVETGIHIISREFLILRTNFSDVYLYQTIVNHDLLKSYFGKIDT